MQSPNVFLVLLNITVLEAGMFDLPVNKFPAQGTKLSIWTSRLQLQDCQSAVR